MVRDGEVLFQFVGTRSDPGGAPPR
jgi:hypothetical protein